ncbi:hypothetical protein ACFLS9_05625 [Bacteroidota bacterium]
MWRLLKEEIKYNYHFMVGVFIMFPAYSIFAITDTNIMSERLFGVDYWGGIFSLMFYVLFFGFWISRIKERRNRMLFLLPLDIKSIAIVRALFNQLILLTAICYLVVIHLLILPVWHEASGGILVQIGMVFIIFAAVIIIRDLWFIIEVNDLTKLAVMFIALCCILAGTFIIFVYLRPLLYDSLGNISGKIVFSVWAIILLSITVCLFIKRKSYLS